VTEVIGEKFALIIGEAAEVLRRVDQASVQKLIDGIVRAEKVFLFGQGRTGYVTRAFAARLMHLGLNVHFVGDTTTPPITSKDLCLVNSGTGETRFSYHVLQAARDAGAATATITAHPEARIAKLADLTVAIPAPTRGQEFGPRASRQPAGSLFEQAVFVLLEGIILILMERLGGTSRDMLKRHANIE
jgi:6-phospho-3-hexuloisomerase